LGAKFYYDFSNLIMFEKTVSSLEKELGEKGKAKNVSAWRRRLYSLIKAY